MSDLLDRIRRETGWSDVREERRTIRWLGQSHHDRKIDLVPSNPQWPEIYFVLSDDYEMLQQFGMGEWHGHPDTMDDAIPLAADFVAGRRCVLERWTKQGKYVGSGVVGPGEIPPSLAADDRAVILRRVFFNRAPQDLKEAPRERGSKHARPGRR